MPSNTEHRLMHLDSIRAIAALMVVMIHCSSAVVPVRPGVLRPGNAIDWLIQDLDFGRIGVVLFFVISGFVIPSSLRDGGRRGEFWVRRILRLYPAYWVSIAAAVAVHSCLSGSAWGARIVLANATMLQSLFHVGDLDGVYWTLKLELAFYAGCWALHRLGLLRRVWVLEGLATALLLVFLFYLDYWSGPFGFARQWIGHGPSALRAAGSISQHPIPGLLNMNWGNFCAYFAAMFTGAALRRWHDDELGAPGAAGLFGVLSIWLVLLPLLWAMRERQGPDPGLISIFLSMPIAVALFIVLTFVVKIRARLLALVGMASYSLYLLHPMVLEIVLALARDAHWQAPARSTPLLILACLALSLPLAGLLFWTVERPAIAAGRRWSKSRPARQPSPV